VRRTAAARGIGAGDSRCSNNGRRLSLVLSPVVLATSGLSARLTAMALSCTAKAYVPKSRGATVAAARRDQRRESDVDRRAAGHVLHDRGGSAAEPRPGRDGFSD
jgi:hypothetical protein